MLRAAIAFFIIALVAALFGFGGIAEGAADIGQILFGIFVILFLIALRMIFPPPGGVYPSDVDQADSEPLLVPLAVPLIAGPSSLASVMFLMSDDPDRWPTWLAAVLLAWVVSGVVLYCSTALARLLKHRGLIAIERLMGMVLIALAVQMFLSGVGEYFTLPSGG